MPSGWKLESLGKLSSAIQYGYTAKAQPEPVGPRLLRITDIQNDAVKWDAVPFCKIKKEEKQKYLLASNDILFARTGATVGKSYLIRDPVPDSVFASYLIRVRLTGEVAPKYIAYFFKSIDYWRQITERQAGIGQPNVNGTKLAQIEIPVAPTHQQQLIVAEIEKQFSRLDEAAANLKRIKANLKHYKAAVLKAAVEGKLTEDWRKQHPDVEPASKLLERILAERRAKWRGRGKYKEPTYPETLNLPFLPQDWGWASPEQLSSAEAYSFAIGPFGSNLKVSDYTDTGVPLIFVRNIRSLNFGDKGRVFVSETKAAELKAHKVSGGDVLVTKMGAPPGDVCLYPECAPEAIITADCIKLRLSQLIPEKRFIVHALNSEVVKMQILAITKGVAQMKVSLARFGGIGIPLPPCAEQDQITSEVERRLSIIDELEAAVEGNLIRADRLRQSILSQAFSGRLLMQLPLNISNTVHTQALR